MTKHRPLAAVLLAAWIDADPTRSKHALARTLDVPVRYVFRWIAGEMAPRRATRERIAWLTGGAVAPDLWEPSEPPVAESDAATSTSFGALHPAQQGGI